MTNITEKERRILEKMAKLIYGCKYDELSEQEQDQLYCIMEEEYESNKSDIWRG